MKRRQLNYSDIDWVIEGIRAQIAFEVSPARKGSGAFASAHEILGALEEERHELLEEIKSNDPIRAIEELRDIAVVCIWGILSLQTQPREKTDEHISTNQTA